MKEQRELQRQLMLKSIDAIDRGSAASGFGLPQSDLRLALVLLEPQAATTTKIHAAVVLRNDSKETLRYYGTESSVLKLSAFDSTGNVVPHTRQGAVYGGSPLPGGPLPGGMEPLMIIRPGGQVVYEINLGEVFAVPPDKPVTFAAMGKLKNETSGVRLEVRSQSAALSPKTPGNAKSVFDEPVIPAWALARMKAYDETNAPVERSNWAALMAQAKPGPARATLQIGGRNSSNMVGVPTNLSLRVTPADVPVVPAKTNKVSDPVPPPEQGRVEGKAEPSQTKYFLAAIVLALLVIGGFLLRRR